MTPRRTDGQTVDVDVSFGHVVDNLKPSGMASFTAKKGRPGFAAHVQYAEIESQSKVLEPLLSRGTLRSTRFVLSALENDLVFDAGHTSLRLGGGARLWSVETDLKLSDDLLPGRLLGQFEAHRRAGLSVAVSGVRAVTLSRNGELGASAL